MTVWLHIVFISCLFSCNVFSQTNNFLKARAFDLQNETDSALFYYNQHINKNPRDEKARIDKANLLVQSNNIDSALNEYFEAEKLKSGVASFYIARLYAIKKDTYQAVYFLEKHLASAYKLPASEILMEPAFANIERSAQWRGLWTKKQWHNRTDALIGEARYMANSGDWMAVTNFVAENSKNNNPHTELLALRALAYIELGNPAMAVTDLNKAIANTKRNPQFFKLRAQAFGLLKNYKAAEPDLNMAISLTPDDFMLYKLRANCYIEMGQTEKALSDVTLLYELFPNNSEIQFLYSGIAFRAKQYLKALPAVNKLISGQVPHSNYYLLRARIYEASQMLLQAQKDYDSSININPNNIEALKARGLFRQKINDMAGACNDWSKAEKAGDNEAGRYKWENKCR